MSLRRMAKNAKKESYLKFLENQFDGINIEDHKFDNMETYQQDLIESIQFTGSGYSEAIGDKLYFNPLLFLAQEDQPFTAEDRAHPIDFNFPSAERYIINLRVPEGMEVEWVTENISVSLPNQMGSFQFRTNVKDDQVLINITKQINTSILAPSYYLYLKEFFEVMVEKENA